MKYCFFPSQLRKKFSLAPVKQVTTAEVTYINPRKQQFSTGRKPHTADLTRVFSSCSLLIS